MKRQCGYPGPAESSRPPAVSPASLDEVHDIPAAKLSVRDTLERFEIVPSKRFGQNFLHDPAVCARIVARVSAAPGSSVLEIGPGLGALTVPLLDGGAHVTAVEVDRRLAEFLHERLADRDTFRLHQGNILEVNLEEVAGDARILVGNLPYSITGPVLSRLVEHADRFDSCVIMLQREVGARLTAPAGGKAIGAIAVLLRLLYRIQKCFEVGTGAFVPRPEIVSVVLRLERIPGASLPAGLRDAVNLAYRHRRKMLRKTLGGVVASEEALAEALVELGHVARARPEDLDPEDWPRLLARVRASS